MKSMLFFTPFGEWQIHNQLDALVAASATTRGYKVKFIACDGIYQPCAITRGEQDCKSCRARMDDTLSVFGVEAIPLSRLLLPRETDNAESWIKSIPNENLVNATYDGLPIGKWALSTAMTHFRMSDPLALNDPKIMPTHRRFVRDTLITYNIIHRYLSENNIDAMFLFNGRFYPYRAALEAAKERNVRVLVHERGRTEETYSFYNDKYCLDIRPMRELQEAWADIPLEESELASFKAYVDQKMRGEVLYWPAFYANVAAADPYSRLDIPKNKKLIGLFTTSSDELAHLEDYRNAKFQFDLIDNIANYLAEYRPDTYLVVRHHPAIGGKSMDQVELVSFIEAYRRAAMRSPNIRIIMPNDEMTSYALFPYLSAAVIPFSSIAIEAISYGIPTLVSKESEIAYSDRSILRDWSGPAVAHAMDRLLNDNAEVKAEDLRRFYRWCYAGVFRFSIKFKAIGIANFFQPSIRSDITDARRAGFDDSVERIFAYFESCQPVLPMPSGKFPANNTYEEKFITEQVAAIQQRKAVSDKDRRARDVASVSPPVISVLLDQRFGEFGQKFWRSLPHGRSIYLKLVGKNSFFNGVKSGAGSRLRVPGLDKIYRYISRQNFVRIISSLPVESYILIANSQAQFHDSSISVMISAAERAKECGLEVIPVSGWVYISESIYPIRFDHLHDGSTSGDRVGLTEEQMALRFPGQFFLFKREWILQKINSLQGMECIGEAARIEIQRSREFIGDSAPVFVLSLRGAH